MVVVSDGLQPLLPLDIYFVQVASAGAVLLAILK